MTVKDKIHGEIEGMAQNELALLYEQIKLMKKARGLDKHPQSPISLEELHRYTSSSKSSWSESIIQDREDRL